MLCGNLWSRRVGLGIALYRSLEHLEKYRSYGSGKYSNRRTVPREWSTPDFVIVYDRSNRRIRATGATARMNLRRAHHSNVVLQLTNISLHEDHGVRVPQSAVMRRTSESSLHYLEENSTMLFICRRACDRRLAATEGICFDVRNFRKAFSISSPHYDAFFFRLSVAICLCLHYRSESGFSQCSLRIALCFSRSPFSLPNNDT